MEEQVISISEIFESLKKRWKLIVIIALSATLLSGIVSFFVLKPQYEANTKVFIGKEEGSEQGYNQSDVIMYQKLMKTYSEAIKTKDLIERAVEKVDTKLEVKDVLAGLTVTNVADTQILEIKFKGKNPQEAHDIVAAVTSEFINTSKTLVVNGNVSVIEEVIVPENPVSPNKTMNIAIAFILGLMVGVGVCFLLEFMDNTFKSKEQLERYIDLPVLGAIPNIIND
ncbi:MAG: Wzz/FepE/Etk N-terminal domain-containing protein [Clostridium sp.]|nr:Wzz/FepE/Etk N-terminal domain-containing protein [Clostridium sp.]MDU7084324.1 Wzz/FepE/Etk N-terminal domain-containing protein [Clostridium sp.]